MDNSSLYTSRERRDTWLLLFLCVFVTDALSLPLSHAIKVIISTVICIYIVISEFILRGGHFDRYGRRYAIIPCMLLLLSQTMNLDFALSYEVKIFQILAGYVLFRRIPFDLFVNKYIKLIYILCLFSIPVWLFYRLGIDIWSWAPTSGDGQYKTLFLYAVDVYSFSGRNNGPFWEPGVFQIYINIAVLFLLFVKRSFNLKYLAVCIVAIITTFSTTGYICLCLLLLTYIFDKGKYIKGYHLFLIVGLLVFGYSYIITHEDIYLSVFGKLNSDSSSSASSIIRMNEIIFYTKVWLASFQNMLIGIGATDAYSQAMSLHSLEVITFEGSTQTTFRELGSFGAIYTACILYLYFQFTLIFSKNVFSRCIIFGVILIMLNTEPLVYSMMFNCLFYLNISKNAELKNAC